MAAEREREKFELLSISEIYTQDLRMRKKKNDAEEKTCCIERTQKKKTMRKRNV